MIVASNDCAGCGGAENGVGPMNYVGHGQGGYRLETGYKYVGFGGDHGRPRRDFTCIICLSSLLLLLPLLLWLLWPRADWCDTGYERCQMVWGVRQQADCCSRRVCAVQLRWVLTFRHKHRWDQLTHSIAPMTTTSGRRVGPSTKSNGAATSMERAAQHQARDMKLDQPTRTIAIRASLIG